MTTGPEQQALLLGTDWGALEHGSGSASDMPAVLTALLSADPEVRIRALGHGLEPVRHQNSIYQATLPVAKFVVAILADERTAVRGIDALPPWTHREPRPRPFRAALLDWLADLAHDADDECVEITWKVCGEESPEATALRSLRPVIFQAVAAFLHDDDPELRHASLVACIPLVEHPGLIEQRTALVPFARELLVDCTDRHYRSRAFDALQAWGHDPTGLVTPEEFAAWAKPSVQDGGCGEDPPF